MRLEDGREDPGQEASGSAPLGCAGQRLGGGGGEACRVPAWRRVRRRARGAGSAVRVGAGRERVGRGWPRRRGAERAGLRPASGRGCRGDGGGRRSAGAAGRRPSGRADAGAAVAPARGGRGGAASGPARRRADDEAERDDRDDDGSEQVDGGQAQRGRRERRGRGSWHRVVAAGSPRTAAGDAPGAHRRCPGAARTSRWPARCRPSRTARSGTSPRKNGESVRGRARMRPMPRRFSWRGAHGRRPGSRAGASRATPAKLVEAGLGAGRSRHDEDVATAPRAPGVRRSASQRRTISRMRRRTRLRTTAPPSRRPVEMPKRSWSRPLGTKRTTISRPERVRPWDRDAVEVATRAEQHRHGTR